MERATSAPSDRQTSPDFSAVHRLVEHAIRAGRTPGAVVIAGRSDGILFRHAWGRRSIVPERQPMTLDTIFDLASLTKPLVTGTLAAWLVEQGKLDLNERAVTYLPEFGAREKTRVSVEQLLLHTSGLPPTNSLRDYKSGADRAKALALGGYLEAYPGRRFMYSDLGYITLGMLIERVTGEPLEVTAERVIWKPLGMLDTRYCRKRCTDPRIAPTELATGWKTSPIRGEVADPRAYRLGGVAGNAGVFSTADDMARFARMLLRGGELDGRRVLSEATVASLTLPRAVPGGRRALGWDVSSGYSAPRGHELSDKAYGHGGYTGTSLWIDPELDLFVLFLSNRNHPFGTGKVTDLQGEVADAFVRALRAAEDGDAPVERVAAPPRGGSLAGRPHPGPSSSHL